MSRSLIRWLEDWDGLQYTYDYDGHHEAPEKDRDEKVSGPPIHVTQAIMSTVRNRNRHRNRIRYRKER